jgi:mRNA-degrading endonuclease toxin of MazEF toxin-antitoxin module
MQQGDPQPRFPRRGEVWLLRVNPITPDDRHLPRPVVIISTNPRNRAWDSIIVVPLSTGLENPHPKFHKPIPSGQGGLNRNTHARCDLVSNLDKSCLDLARGPLGKELSDLYVWEIVRGIRACIGDNPDL